MMRSVLLALATSLVLVSGEVCAQGAAGDTKTLRYAFRIAETNFDPAQITDLYSRTVATAFFEAPLEFAYLARPVRMRPATAAAMPEVSADFKTFTFRLKPGIYFTDDPAFKGQKRELVAAGAEGAGDAEGAADRTAGLAGEAEGGLGPFAHRYALHGNAV